MRFYRGIFYIYPIKRITLIFSLIILCGFPLLVGFYSKDLIIEVYFFNKIMILCLIFLLFSTILTISYSFRIIINNWAASFNFVRCLRSISLFQRYVETILKCYEGDSLFENVCIVQDECFKLNINASRWNRLSVRVLHQWTKMIYNLKVNNVFRSHFVCESSVE